MLIYFCFVIIYALLIFFLFLQKDKCVYTLLVYPCKYKMKNLIKKNIETVCVVLSFAHSYTRGSFLLTNGFSALLHTTCSSRISVVYTDSTDATSKLRGFSVLLFHNFRLISVRRACDLTSSQ